MASQPVPQTDAEYKIDLPIRSEEALRRFIWIAFGVRVPDTKCCELHTTPWRALCDAYFARSSASIWEGSRGFAGKSFLLALLGSVEWCTLPADVNVLGGSGEQAKRIIEYTEGLWHFERAPRFLIESDNITVKKLFEGHKLQALMASQKSVRGPHPQRLRVDEADEVKLDILDAALGQPMAKGAIRPQIVFSSTHHHADGTMTELKRRARRFGWPIYAWCYKESLQPHGWLSPADVAEKRSVIPAEMWSNEYELQEPNPSGRAIVPATVEKMFQRELGEASGYDDELHIFEAPKKGGRYAHGADWARKIDRSVFITRRIDVKPFRLVAFRAINRQPWPVMERYFIDQIKMYGGRAMHDATGGGDVVDSHLGNMAEPFILTGRDRTELFADYVAEVERGEFVSPYIKLMYDEHKVAGVDDLFRPGGHPPDTIVGSALASRAGAVPEAGWASA